MKVVIIGASEVGIMATQILLSRRHDVVIVEKNREVIDTYYDELDCSFIHGDGTRPALLREADPGSADVLFSVTDSDQSNIIASLVGRSLGAKLVVTSIVNPEFEGVCLELGLEHTIVPSRTIARYLADMVAGIDVPELSTAIRGEARFFLFVAGESDDGTSLGKLELPSDARVVCYYRDDEFHMAKDDGAVRPGDELVVLTHARNLPALRERFQPKAVVE